jgi:hypothetical protein
MKALSILRRRPAVFFRLSGIRIEDFDDLVRVLHPLWLSQEQKCTDLHRGNRNMNMIVKNIAALANINLKTA